MPETNTQTKPRWLSDAEVFELLGWFQSGRVYCRNGMRGAEERQQLSQRRRRRDLARTLLASRGRNRGRSA